MRLVEAIKFGSKKEIVKTAKYEMCVESDSEWIWCTIQNIRCDRQSAN